MCIIVGLFYFAISVAAFTAIPFASVQISGESCVTRNENQECRASQLGIVLTMSILGLLANCLTLAGIIALPLFLSYGFTANHMQKQVDVALDITPNINEYPRAAPRINNNNNNNNQQPASQTYKLATDSSEAF